MNTSKRFLRGVACAAVFAAALLSTQATLAADNTLNWPSRYSFKDWDPAATYSEETYVLGNIYETLTFYVDGKVVPRLATSWEKSDGGATWTMQLREGVKFHDGSESRSIHIHVRYSARCHPSTRRSATCWSR